MMSTLQAYRRQERFRLHAFVVMPDHVHTLITPAPDVSLEKALQLMKGGFSFRLKSRLEVWERGHFDKRVPTHEAYEACVSYIHQNPVVARLAQSAEAYRFSSASMSEEVDVMPEWFGKARG